MNMKIILLEVPLPAYDFPFCLSLCICLCLSICFSLRHGGRSWQPSGEGKNGNKMFVRLFCYFRDRCIVFAHNCKFANSIQYVMQFISCNSAFLAQETLFLTPKALFLAKVFQKVRESQRILILQKNRVC